MVRTEIETETNKRVGTERTKQIKTERAKETRAKRTEDMETKTTRGVGTDNSNMVRGEVKKENIVDKAHMGFAAAAPEMEQKEEVLKTAVKASCFIPDFSLNELEDEYRLVIESFCTEKRDPAYGRSSKQRSSCARPVELCSRRILRERDMDDAKRLLGSVTAFGAHGKVYCSDVIIYYWNTRHRAEKEEVENVEEDLEG